MRNSETYHWGACLLVLWYKIHKMEEGATKPEKELEIGNMYEKVRDSREIWGRRNQQDLFIPVAAIPVPNSQNNHCLRVCVIEVEHTSIIKPLSGHFSLPHSLSFSNKTVSWLVFMDITQQAKHSTTPSTLQRILNIAPTMCYNSSKLWGCHSK